MKFILTQILLCCFVFKLHSQSSQFTQASGSPFLNASNQNCLITRDMNADGKKDILTANLYNNSISVLLGNGNGQFTHAQGSPIPIFSGPASLTSGDFNGDSHLDLATANYYTGDVTILLGNSTGSFTIFTTISTTVYPFSIDVADFNMDGKLDLVTGSVTNNTIYILLGNGSGGFSSNGAPMAIVGMPYHLSTGNLNSDSFPDFVAVKGGGQGVDVYFGNGSGGFNPPVVYYTPGSDPRRVTLKDLNADGYLDMAIANGFSDNITILLGSSSGNFSQAPGSPFYSGDIPYQCAVADYNLDGKLDIATARHTSNVLTIFSGNGNGTFNSIANNTISLGNGPLSIVTEDFNGDNKPDLTIGYWYDNYTSIYLNTSCNVLSSFSYTLGTNGLVSFSNNSSGTLTASTYTWNYGDSNTSYSFQSSHTYTSAGNYTVILKVNNNVSPSCVHSSTQVINPEFNTVGISTQKVNKTPGIFPNPTNGNLIIDNPDPNVKREFILYNLLGREMHRGNLNPGTNIITISHLEAGVYSYQIADEHSLLQSSQIILIK